LTVTVDGKKRTNIQTTDKNSLHIISMPSCIFCCACVCRLSL